MKGVEIPYDLLPEQGVGELSLDEVEIKTIGCGWLD
jgi:hypothetical protein